MFQVQKSVNQYQQLLGLKQQQQSVSTDEEPQTQRITIETKRQIKKIDPKQKNKKQERHSTSQRSQINNDLNLMAKIQENQSQTQKQNPRRKPMRDISNSRKKNSYQSEEAGGLKRQIQHGHHISMADIQNPNINQKISPRLINTESNQINYKLMEKKNLINYSNFEFNLLKEAILNVLAHIPQSIAQKSSASNNLITQKALVESLEQQIILATEKQKQKIISENSLYREALKLHSKFHKFIQTNSQKNLSLDSQISLLLSFFKINLIDQQVQLTKAMNQRKRYLFSKGFISLLQNMMMQSKAEKLNLDLIKSSKSDVISNDYINQENKFSASNNCIQMHQKPPQGPKRVQNYEKKQQDSPVRDFLYQEELDDNTFQFSVRELQQLPQAESTSRSDITQKYSSYEYKLIFIGLKALQNNAKEQINIKSYGQSQKSDLEEYKKITESVLIAGTHYRTYILQKSWYCLVQATAQSKLTFQEIQNKKVQLLYLKVMAALKQNLFFNLQRETNIIVLNSKRNNYLLSNCFDCIKYQVKQKKLKIHKFIKQRAWIYKQQIFKQSFVSLLQRAQDLNGLCEELLEEKDIQIKKDFFRNWKNSIHIIDRGEVIRYFQKNRKKVLKNLFQFWKNKTIKNSKEKKKIKQFVLNQKKLKKFELFKDWLLLTHQFQLSNNIKSQSLYSKTIRSLLLNVQQTQLFEQKSQAFQEKIQKNSLEQVFNFWINYNNFQKNQIKLVQNFKKKFQFQKLRDIFKLWFNQIDVLRRWNFLNQNTNLWYSRKKKRVVFNALRTEIGLRTRFKKVQKLKTSQLLSSSFVALKENLELKYKFKSVQQIWMASVAKRFLKQWYLSLSRQLRNKLKVQKVLHKKLVYKTFKAIQIHTVNSKFFNQGLQKLLELRAYNLQKRSFVFGLKKWWHFSVIENSLWRAAKISDANRLQQKVMLAFKQTSLKYMQAQVIKSKVSGHLIKHYFYSWLQELSKMQKANKFFSQVQQKLSQKVYNFLVDRTNKKKAKKGLIQYFRRETQQIQIVQIFNAFKFQLEKRNLKKQKYETDQIKNFHSKFIAQSIFNAWICIKENNFEQRQIFDKFQKKLRLQEKMKIFRVFKQSFVLASIRKKVAKKNQKFVLRECFNSLSIWGFYANNERQIALKVAKNMMNQCFQGLKRYSGYKTYFKAKESEIGFQKVKQKQAQIFSFWRKLAQRSIQFKQNYVQIEKIRRSNHFGIWRNILEETKKEKNFIKFHNQSLIKKAFGALKSLDKVELPEDKNNLKILQVQFHDYIKKKRAIRKLKSNITCQQVIKSYKNISNLYNFQRIFKAWFQAIKHSRRKTVLSKSAFDLRQTVLLEKCLNRLKLYAKKRARARILIDQFQQTSEMITKNNVLLALQNHVIFVKERAQFFYQLINLSASVRTEQAFSQWIQFTIEKRLDQRADAFFKMRKSQYLQRTAFDSLKIHYLSKDVRKYKFSAIHKWDNQRVIKKAFYALKRITHSANRLNFCQSLIGQKKDLNFLSFCFKAFVNGVLILKISKKMKEKAQSFHQHNSKKRVFVAFAMTQNSFKVKSLLEEKREKRIRRTCLLAWQKTYIQKKKMDRMIQIFEDESCCKLTTSFFPRLIKKTYISQIFEHLKDKRQTNIQIAFINEIRKSIFLKKVLKLYVQRKQQILIKSVFLGLRASALKEVQHKSQLNDLEETFVQKGEQELLQIAFNSLQQNLVKKRYKKVADGCFKIRILRQCLGELQKYYYKMQIQKHKTTEIIKMRQARWFQNWITAYFKEKNKNQAQDYLQTTQLLQIMNAWRKLAIKSKKAFFFKDKIIDTSMIRKCFQSWFYFIRKEKELQKIKSCITISREKNTQRNYFIKWLALESDIKLNRKMQIYYKQNFLHKIMKKWQKVKNEKNNRRQNVFKIKQILAARPGLARPLLVLKNKLLFKAFNALVDNTHEEYKEESLEEKAAFAYFFKLERKTFLVLKHHKYENIQEQQADQFHQLFLQKRFLYLLMDGSLILKARRRERQKAMIFRFLSLQKKGLQGLLVNRQKTQEQQIRAYAAYVLCQKRILSLGFCSLKVWAQQRKQYVQNI